MSDSIKIVPVSSKKETKLFIRFPWAVYRGETNYENWVPPLLIGEDEKFDTKKNPFFQHADMQLFLAYKGDKLVGRIAAIIDYNYVEYQKDESGFFGYFESFNDQEVADALLRAAEEWILGKGYKNVIGPCFPSTGTSVGTLIDSFDLPPVIEMTWNPDYYPALIEKSGYGKAKDLYCYKMMKDTLQLSEKMIRVSDIAKKRNNISIRKVNMKDWDFVVKLLKEIYNEAWAENWGFVPWTDEEFDHNAKDLKMAIIPELVLVAYMGDEPVGFAIPIPDLNQIFKKMNGRLLPTGLFKLLLGKNKVDIIRVAILGIKKKAHNKGIDAILVREIYERADKLGMQGSELSWILEDNLPLVNLLNGWGAEHYRTYRVYDRKLS